ncbi:hypothetical protein [Konateibacter massiliensis]|uniref:hypothetical protein n=1 Tax=Konateibacter massiliensis TaxID=2002841 RepID=UPI000C14671C|nr:hypothetical protein [Konateibacter massiliensis]
MKRIKLLPIIIMLTAGLITCVISFVKGFDNIYALTALLIVLVSFYIIGLIARTVIIKICFPKPKEEEGEETATEEADGEKEEQPEQDI